MVSKSSAHGTENLIRKEEFETKAYSEIETQRQETRLISCACAIWFAFAPTQIIYSSQDAPVQLQGRLVRWARAQGGQNWGAPEDRAVLGHYRLSPAVTFPRGAALSSAQNHPETQVRAHSP